MSSNDIRNLMNKLGSLTEMKVTKTKLNNLRNILDRVRELDVDIQEQLFDINERLTGNIHIAMSDFADRLEGEIEILEMDNPNLVNERQGTHNPSEKEGMKTHYGKSSPNYLKTEDIEVDDEGAIAIVTFNKDYDWKKVSNLANSFNIGIDILDDDKSAGEAGKYYLQADDSDNIEEFTERLYFYDKELLSMDELTEDVKNWLAKAKT